MRCRDLSYLVALAAVTITWMFISFVLYCINKLLPPVVIFVDTLMLGAWIASVVRYLVVNAETLISSCKWYSYDWYGYGDDYYEDYSLESIQCQIWKGLFGLMVVEL